MYKLFVNDFDFMVFLNVDLIDPKADMKIAIGNALVNGLVFSASFFVGCAWIPDPGQPVFLGFSFLKFDPGQGWVGAMVDLAFWGVCFVVWEIGTNLESIFHFVMWCTIKSYLTDKDAMTSFQKIFLYLLVMLVPTGTQLIMFLSVEVEFEWEDSYGWLFIVFGGMGTFQAVYTAWLMDNALGNILF